MASQITGVSVIYSIIYSCADQRKHQSSVSLVFVRGVHRWPMNSPHKGPVTRKMFPSDDVIMTYGKEITGVTGRFLSQKSVSCYDVIITQYLPVANRTHSLAPQPRSKPHTWTSPKSWWNYQNRLIGCRSTASPEKKQRRMQFVLTIFFQDGKTHKKCLTKTNIASRHFITMTS